MPNGVQVRVTQNAIAELEADPAGLVDSLLGSSGGAFNVPASCGGDFEICCDNGTPAPECGPVNIDLVPQNGDADRLEVNVTNGNGHVQVVIRARVTTANDLPISADTGFGTANCDISIDSTAAGAESITISVDLDIANNPTTNTVEILNADAVVSDIDDNDVSLDGNAVCFLADTFLKGTIVSTLRDELENTIESLLGEALCKSCPSGDVADCGEFADACTDGVCMRGASCLQELGIAGRIGGAAFSGFSSGHTGNMDLYEVAGGYAETATGGISMGMLSGMLPAAVERDRCAPAGTRPADVTINRSTFFEGDTRPDTGNPFGVGIGIHKQNLDLFSWSAHDAGLLCLNIGPQTVDVLNSDTFSLLMPSLVQLAHTDVAPVLLGLRPQNQPVFTLGAGTTTAGGEIDEPLILVELPQLEIDFFAFIDYQWIRVMTMSSDVSLPINLEVDADGALTPVIGDIEGAFANIVVTNSEALRETPEDLAAQFPVLLELAVPLLADGLSIDLPALGALTLAIQPDGITSIEGNTILAIFADLETAPPPSARVVTSARVTSIDLPERAYFSAPGAYPETRPAVTLELGGESEMAGDLEFSTRIDGGLWSPYSRDRNPVIASRIFALQGRHRVEVRSRVVGQPGTTDRTPAVVEVPIDHVGPRVDVRYGFAGKVWVSARDYVAGGPIDVEYKLPGGDWQSAGAAPQGGPIAIDIGDAAPADVLVRAADSAGHATEGNPIVGFHGAGDGGGCECQSSRSSAGGFLVILLAGLLAWRRRVRADLLIGLFAAAIATGGAACNCGGDDFQPGEAERGPAGRWLSMAGDDTRVVIAGYEEEFGDLVLVDVAVDGGASGELSFRAADGVPNVDPVHDPKTYRGGVLDPGANVGAWTSIALSGGSAIIAHQDLDALSLRFVRETGDTFSSHAVDGENAVRAGYHTSVAVRDGVPTIAYQVVGVANADGAIVSQLRFAVASSDAPSSASDWTIDVVDEAPISCAGMCLEGSACVEQGGAEICAPITADCSTECGDGDTCISGSCVSVIEAAASYDHNPGTGLFARQVTLGDGRAAIIYYNRESGDLMAAVEDGGGWTIAPLDAAAATDTGAHAAAAVDEAGLVHVVYQDAISDRLLYLTWDGQTASAPEVIDDGVRAGEVKTHPVGAGAAIRASGGQVIITYQDGLTADLMIARGSAGAFTTEVLRGGPTLDGFFTGVVDGLGGTWAGAYSYDRNVGRAGEIIVLDAR